MALHRSSIKAPFLALLMLTLAACTDEDGAIDTLTKAGYTDITITGGVWLGCEGGEIYRTGFVAIGPGKSVVHGVVCKQGGFWGSSVIRTYS
jgi:hypothetical protein